MTTVIDGLASPLPSTSTLARRETSTVATDIHSRVVAALGPIAGTDKELVRAAVFLATAANTSELLEQLRRAALGLAELVGLMQFSPLYVPKRNVAYAVWAAYRAASGQSPVSVG